jgi:hypothetical protein
VKVITEADVEGLVKPLTVLLTLAQELKDPPFVFVKATL